MPRRSRNRPTRRRPTKRTAHRKRMTKKTGSFRRRIRGGNNESIEYVNIPGYGSISTEEYRKIMNSPNPITGDLDG